jgi:hypothetical protein
LASFFSRFVPKEAIQEKQDIKQANPMRQNNNLETHFLNVEIFFL